MKSLVCSAEKVKHKSRQSCGARQTIDKCVSHVGLTWLGLHPENVLRVVRARKHGNCRHPRRRPGRVLAKVAWSPVVWCGVGAQLA